MRSPPLAVLATWPESNYHSPDTRGPAVLVVEMVLLPLAVLAVAGRMYARAFVLKRMWLDDWLMLLSVALCIGLTVDVILATQQFGWNIHIWDVTVTSGQRGRMASIAAQTLYLMASTTIKTAILVQYLRLVPLKGWFRRMTWLSLAFVVLTATSFILVVWLQCIPIRNYWLLADEKHCLDEQGPAMAQAAASLAADGIIYVLPMPIFLKLRLSKKQRAGLICLFGIGLLVVAAGALRLYFTLAALKSYDVTWKGFPMWLCTAVEVNLGVVCACVPTLKPIFRSSETAVNHRTSGEEVLTDDQAVERAEEGDAEETMGIEEMLQEMQERRFP